MKNFYLRCILFGLVFMPYLGLTAEDEDSLGHANFGQPSAQSFPMVISDREDEQSSESMESIEMSPEIEEVAIPYLIDRLKAGEKFTSVMHVVNQMELIQDRIAAFDAISTYYLDRQKNKAADYEFAGIAQYRKGLHLVDSKEENEQELGSLQNALKYFDLEEDNVEAARAFENALKHFTTACVEVGDKVRADLLARRGDALFMIGKLTRDPQKSSKFVRMALNVYDQALSNRNARSEQTARKLILAKMSKALLFSSMLYRQDGNREKALEEACKYTFHLERVIEILESQEEARRLAPYIEKLAEAQLLLAELTDDLVEQSGFYKNVIPLVDHQVDKDTYDDKARTADLRYPLMLQAQKAYKSSQADFPDLQHLIALSYLSVYKTVGLDQQINIITLAINLLTESLSQKSKAILPAWQYELSTLVFESAKQLPLNLRVKHSQTALGCLQLSALSGYNQAVKELPEASYAVAVLIADSSEGLPPSSAVPLLRRVVELMEFSAQGGYEAARRDISMAKLRLGCQLANFANGLSPHDAEILLTEASDILRAAYEKSNDNEHKEQLSKVYLNLAYNYEKMALAGKNWEELGLEDIHDYRRAIMALTLSAKYDNEEAKKCLPKYERNLGILLYNSCEKLSFDQRVPILREAKQLLEWQSPTADLKAKLYSVQRLLADALYRLTDNLNLIQTIANLSEAINLLLVNGIAGDYERAAIVNMARKLSMCLMMGWSQLEQPLKELTPAVKLFAKCMKQYPSDKNIKECHDQIEKLLANELVTKLGHTVKK